MKNFERIIRRLQSMHTAYCFDGERMGMMSSYVLYKDKLKGEYLDLFERIEIYGISMMIEDNKFEEAMMSLVDVMCEAQSEGRPATDIVGKDVEMFCKEFFENPNYAKNWFSDIPNLAYRFSVISLIFFVLDIVFPETETSNIMNLTSDMAPAVIGLLFGMVLSAILSVVIRKIAPRKRIRLGVLAGIGIICMATSGILTFALFEEYDMKVPAVVSTLVCLVYILGYKMIVWKKRYEDHGNIRRTEEEKSRTFRGVFQETLKETMENESVDLDLLKNLHKKYNRKNRKKPISYEEFDAKLWKEQKSMEKESKYLGIFFLVLVICSVAGTSLTSTLADTLIFAVILSVMEFLIWKFFKNTTKLGYEMRQKILDKAKEENITVIELAIREENVSQC